MPKPSTSTATDAAAKTKKPSIFLVAGPTGNRLIRAESVSVVRQRLFGEIKISKATGEDVANILQSGNSIEETAAPADTAGTDGADGEKVGENIGN
jgi:hypothetical protein